MEETECFETLAYKIRKPGNYAEENIQHSEHGESLKSRVKAVVPGSQSSVNGLEFASNKFSLTALTEFFHTYITYNEL